MVVKVELQGLKNVQNKLLKTYTKVSSELSNNLMKAGFILEGAVKQNIASYPSVDTGRFLNSVHTSRLSDSSVTVSDAIGYGGYLEFGTSKIAARKHFQKAVRTKKAEIINILKRGVEKSVKALG
ncbi:MAG: hypothetical protein KKF65_07175 [Nanoarchaeota archaeon]|nr:hypothetical protein [Nanoarchaeota archaeon]